MKKNLLLYILLVFLVVMNGFFLFKHFGKSEAKHPQRSAPVNFISDRLQFDADQSKRFKKLDEAHREKIVRIVNDIRESKDALFEKVSDVSIDDSTIDSLTTQIAIREKEKELETFRFFKAVGEICNDDQKVVFESIIKDALRRQGPGANNRPPPRGPRPPDDEGRPPPPRQ